MDICLMHFSSVICPLRKPSLACEGHNIDVRPLQKFFCLFFYLYFWPCWVFVAAQGLSLDVVSQGYSWLLWAGFSYYRGFSCCRSQALGPTGFGRCRTRTQLFLCGTWDLPRPGVEPVSPALTGRFLTTRPARKSWGLFFFFFELLLWLKCQHLSFF